MSSFLWCKERHAGVSSPAMCHCSADDKTVLDWRWDVNNKSAGTYLVNGNREARFHVDYSNGTAAVRGAMPMKSGQHYWEIKMVSPVYGTDMMVGIGTEEAKLDEYRHVFTSLLGKDKHSWGLSYFGSKQHAGRRESFTHMFGEGTVIGVHLDLWHGLLTYYQNKRLIGIAYRGLTGGVYYPMVSSTAARSGMRIVCAYSFNTTLQYLCCRVLRTLIPPTAHVLDAVTLPPGLRSFLGNNLQWLLNPCPRLPHPPPPQLHNVPLATATTTVTRLATDVTRPPDAITTLHTVAQAPTTSSQAASTSETNVSDAAITSETNVSDAATTNETNVSDAAVTNETNVSDAAITNETNVSDATTTNETNVSDAATRSEINVSDAATTSETNVSDAATRSETNVSYAATRSETNVSDAATTSETSVSDSVAATRNETNVSHVTTTNETNVSDPATTSETNVSDATTSETNVSDATTTSETNVSDATTTSETNLSDATSTGETNSSDAGTSSDSSSNSDSTKTPHDKWLRGRRKKQKLG